MPIEQNEVLLAINQVSAAYGNRIILKNITLNVNRGEILAVVGPNGAGKTTLLRTVSGILKPKSGSVKTLGQNLTSLSSMQRASYLAVVPQARDLPGAFTVYQTILMGRTPHFGWLGRAKPADHHQVTQVMALTDTLCLSDRRIGELSGGEQQRVLLARALAQKTPVLLLDEPTAHLDLRHQSALLSLVATTTREQGLAVLLAAHDLNLIALYADRIAILVDGELYALGTPHEVLTPENIETAYQVAVRVITHPDHGTPLVLPDGHYAHHTTTTATTRE